MRICSKAHYIMIGGFLGAGKTTAVAKLAQYLTQQGLKVGLITNDQGRNLVDTTFLRCQGFATEEIPGGCFCCRFNSLVDAAVNLREQTHPDVIIAEPVGSCTDIIATVAYPLRRLYGDSYDVAPVSVLLDPIRALRVFGLESGDTFSEKVLYIYNKQLEEADLIVISKCDLLDASKLEALQKAIVAKFPGKEVLAVSSRNGTNLDTWFEKITSQTQGAGTAMKVDYQIYAEGEALLGWLNCTVKLSAKSVFDSDKFLSVLSQELQNRLCEQRAEIAHLKMTLTPEEGDGIGVINLVRNDFIPEISIHPQRGLKSGQLVINLRAETTPDVLGTAVRESLSNAAHAFPGLTATLDHLEHFRPGKPSPTHRFTEITA